MTPEIQQLRELLNYTAETGELFWEVARGTMAAGAPAGSYNRDGYRKILINRKSQLVHRVVWAIHYGEWPENDLDHINGKKDDNRIINLRKCVDWQNRGNTIRKAGGAGYPGVRCMPNGAYGSEIVFKKKRFNLGTFARPEDAGTAYELASIFLLKEFSPFHPQRAALAAQAKQGAQA